MKVSDMQDFLNRNASKMTDGEKRALLINPSYIHVSAFIVTALFMWFVLSGNIPKSEYIEKMRVYGIAIAFGTVLIYKIVRFVFNGITKKTGWGWVVGIVVALWVNNFVMRTKFPITSEQDLVLGGVAYVVMFFAIYYFLKWIYTAMHMNILDGFIKRMSNSQ
jgi:hypothetical protein